MSDVCCVHRLPARSTTHKGWTAVHIRTHTHRLVSRQIGKQREECVWVFVCRGGDAVHDRIQQRREVKENQWEEGNVSLLLIQSVKHREEQTFTEITWHQQPTTRWRLKGTTERTSITQTHKQFHNNKGYYLQASLLARKAANLHDC